MIKCPECGEEIDCLYNWESGGMGYVLFPDNRYEEGEFLPDGKTNEFNCPECQKTLFTNEIEALEFLKEAEGEE